MSYEPTITITTLGLIVAFCGPDRDEVETVEALKAIHGEVSEQAIREWIAEDIDNDNIAVGVDKFGREVCESHLVEFEIEWAAEQIWHAYEYHLLEAATAAPS